MELHGETLIAAPRERVWDALNDPEVLARCIDGVESLTRTDGHRFEGTLNARVGPVRAKFSGAVTLFDLEPPHSYRISGEGKGGVAGFARGSASVTLEEADGGTRLIYTATSSVGGKLAQLGSRMIEGVAKGYAETFFTRLKDELETPSSLAPGTVAAADVAALAAAEIPALPAETFVAPERRRIPAVAWVAGALVVLIVVMLLVFR